MKKFQSYIKESKENCKTLFHLDPKDVPYLTVDLSTEQIASRRQKYSQVLDVVLHFMKKVIEYMEGIPTVIVTTDHEGVVLDIYGDPTIKQMVSSLGITVGARFDEKDVGTNSISLAIKHEEPIALIGKDHFHDYLSGVACYSAPLNYSTEEQGLMGTVSIMTMIDYASQFYLGLLSSAAETIEREIQIQMKNQQLHLLNNVLMDSTPLGILLVDNNKLVLEFNQSAEAILHTKKELVYKNGIKELEGIEEYIEKVFSTGEKLENVEITFSVKEKDIQKKKTILLDVLPLIDSTNQMLGIFAQLRDITSYQALQQKVVESEKLSAIGKLSAGLAHEIRNPLTSIIGLTQLLNESNQGNRYLKIIRAELERMKGLVNQFVTFGKPACINTQITNLVDVINDTVELMNSNAQFHNVNIMFLSNKQEITVRIDEAKIKQVIINFIKNALEAIRIKGTIQLTVTEDIENDFVHIAIKDDGEGMTKEQVEKLGTPFFTTKESGLGMGLPICFEIVKSHNGNIQIDSQKNKGTTITITLPYEA